MPDTQYDASDYTVGWVCALPLEMAAAKAMLDEIHPNLSEQAPADHNSYLLGRVQRHNVVIACLPAGIYGTTPAATVAKDMLRTFKSIRFGLMVGIGGGAPSSRHDIRLGDIVVSQPSGTTGGVIQYDRGKDGRDGHFERTGSLNTPPKILLTALGRLQVDHSLGDSRIPEFLAESFQKYPKMRKAFTSRGESNDCLFEAEYEHASDESGCHQCDRARSVQRDARDNPDPVVHYGNVASGNLVIKNASTRDQLSKDLGVLCFEMEAAGLMQDFPCLVIRGICDYADTHKNKEWQGYAAVVAAAFAKELLSVIPPERVLQEKVIPQLVSDPVLQELLSATKETISKHAMEQDTRYENDKQIECHRAFKTSRYEDFKNINPDRVSGTCKWVLEHPQYQKWRRSSHDDLLWISADPGCGKSVLAKALIDEELDNAGDHMVCYFFFKDNEDQDSLSTALCAVLHQLFGRLPHLLRHATNAFDKNGQKLQNEVDELWRIFLAAATDGSANAVTCVLDALDECQGEDRRKLVRLLTDFYCRRPSAPTGSFQLKFLVTSRPYQDIETGFNHIPSELPSIRLAGEESNADIGEEINLVIRQKIASAGDKLHPDRDVRDALQAKLLATQNRTYLWLHLIWDELEQSRKRTKRAFLNKIDSLPSTVEDAYERILARNSRGDQEEARVLLHIVVGARRPLTVQEMDVAFQLAVESPNALQHQDLDLDGDQLKTRIRELCGLFVFINDNRVHLIHQTAKEFLIAKAASDASADGAWRHSLSGRQSSKIMAEVCIQYLSFQDLQDKRYDEKEGDGVLIDDFPLLEYSSVNWPAHYRNMGEAGEGLFSRLYNLYDTENVRFQTWVSIFWKATHEYMERDGLEVMHLAALNGHDQVISRLMQGGQISVDVQDGRDMTPLQWAALEGHGDTVKLLLERGADVNAQGGRYRNALQAASWGGHNETIKLLLERGADVNAQDGEYGNALQAASWGVHNETIKLLLERGADVNAQGGFYGNVLQAASSRGYNETIKLLLERGADVNAQGGIYSNALQAASWGGHNETIKLLLERGADVNAQGGIYGNALQAATWGGHHETIKLLLERGADVNAQDGKYGNALQAASSRGYNETIKLLLERGADVNAQDMIYGNALQAASSGGYIETIKLLLERGADVNAQGGEYGNALQAASFKGYIETIKLLLERGADVNAQGGIYSNALQAALFKGDNETIKLLLERGADVNAQGIYGHTPLSLAASRGLAAAMKLLLTVGNANPNKGDSWNRTPLSWAAQNGHEAAVKLLLDTDNVHVDVPDNSDRTPLFWAAEEGHLVVVKMLASRRDVNLAVEDACGLTALQLAVFNQHEDVETLLLAHGAPVVADFYGLQALLDETMALSDSP